MPTKSIQAPPEFAIRHIEGQSWESDSEALWKRSRTLSSRSLRSSTSTTSSRLFEKTGSISKYHEDCHGDLFDLEPEARAEQKFNEKLSNLKRMILTVKMTQTPLDLNYNGRISNFVSPNKKKSGRESKIPIWRPVSPFISWSPPNLLSQDVTRIRNGNSSSNKLLNDEMQYQSEREEEEGPFIKSLVPHVTSLSSTHRETPSPYRAKFQSSYDRIYNELATTSKRAAKNWY